MWKLIRYSVGDEYVVGIGTFSTYAAMFFTRGRELDETGFLEGSGKEARFIRLRAPKDAAQPALTRVLRRALAAVGTGSQAQATRSSSNGRSQRARSAAAR